MKNLLTIGTGLFFGIILTGVIAWNMMPSMMINVVESPYNIEKTVEKIKLNIESSEGWSISKIRPAHKNLKKLVGGVIPKTFLIDICDPNYAFDVLQNDSDRKLSLFMPCTISVYNDKNGKTYIATMNALLLGKMFGGNVATVMEKVSVHQKSFIAFAHK